MKKLVLSFFLSMILLGLSLLPALGQEGPPDNNDPEGTYTIRLTDVVYPMGHETIIGQGTILSSTWQLGYAQADNGLVGLVVMTENYPDWVDDGDLVPTCVHFRDANGHPGDPSDGGVFQVSLLEPGNIAIGVRDADRPGQVITFVFSDGTPEETYEVPVQTDGGYEAIYRENVSSFVVSTHDSGCWTWSDAIEPGPTAVTLSSVSIDDGRSGIVIAVGIFSLGGLLIGVLWVIWPRRKK